MDIIAVIIALIVPIGVAIWTVRSSAKALVMGQTEVSWFFGK